MAYCLSRTPLSKISTFLDAYYPSILPHAPFRIVLPSLSAGLRRVHNFKMGKAFSIPITINI